MTLLVDHFVYPWDRPVARQLLEILCELYPDRDSVVAVAEDVGLRRSSLNIDKPPSYLWRDILSKLAPRAQLRTLIARVQEENPDSPRQRFFQDLSTLEPEQIVLDARPPSRGGSPFLAGNAEITRPEALLFHDDLSLRIGMLPWLMGALDRVGALASAVCKIVSTGPAGTQDGTGFLIGPDLVMTNWHVVETDGERAFSLRALFGFDDDGAGGLKTPVGQFTADSESIDGEADDDWAVFRLLEGAPKAAAVIRLDEAAEAKAGDAAFVIQHPGGGTKRIAYARNTVTAVDPRVIHYLSDTRQGSSGSPVLNHEGRIIALHHAGGQPQVVAGRAPVVKNEGINIQRVAERMRIKGLAAA